MTRHRSTPPEPYALHPQLAADSHPLASLALCELRLMDDCNYPWLVLVPRVPGARELIDLDPGQRVALMGAVAVAERLLLEAVRPHKLNVAALGNLVTQLHVHVIARFEGDPAWPAPAWGRVAARPYSPEALVERIALLRDGLAGARARHAPADPGARRSRAVAAAGPPHRTRPPR